jgi:hypothetical protein
MSERDQFMKEIDRLLSSRVLHGSESLCKLLQYLARQALEHPAAPLKEYQIATEVYGRPAGFDPQLDSTIRVQAGRLRAKLTEYYISEGAEDPIIVELPKGTYHLSFHQRAAADLKAQFHSPPTSEHEHGLALGSSRNWLIVVTVLATLLATSVGMIGKLLSTTRFPESALASATEPVAPEFQAFWQPFVDRPEDPWVIFSNAAFVGRPETGMRYYDASRDSRDQIWDHYTGVGEVLAVHNLDQVFQLFHRRLRVKRGSLFSLDDAENNNLIFIGSPSENLTLSDIPSTKQFVFQRLTSGSRKGDLAIVRQGRQPGEPEVFLASPSGSPLTEDYAVIGLIPGLTPSRSVMILAGTTTFGTQGAVEYVSRQDTLHTLLSRLSVSKPGDLKPFEALLRVKITRGVPTETDLIAAWNR